MTYLEPKSRTYLFQTLDPLHMGTGGTRLGRVDNTVARDPVTRLPKAPGTGLSGAVKDAYDLKLLVDEKKSGQRCAGASGCGKPGCRVCSLFGSAPGEESSDKKSRRGVMAFRDGMLAAMPVSTITGPAWIVGETFARTYSLINNAITLGGLDDPTAAASETMKSFGDQISLGSFLLKHAGTINENDFADKVTMISGCGFTTEQLKKVASRMVVCNDAVFPLLAETAMEVRTSVTIDPRTGAADPGKLFTYEAVPAGAVFAAPLDYLGGEFPEDAFKESKSGSQTSDTLFDEIEKNGFAYLDKTGIGGNVTRGFGRVRFFGCFK